MKGFRESETSKKPSWSIIRKAQIIGALIGAVGTIGFMLIGNIFHNPHTHGIPDAVGMVAILISLPTYWILKTFGLESLIASHAFLALVLICLTNSVLLFIVGTSFGCFVTYFMET